MHIQNRFTCSIVVRYCWRENVWNFSVVFAATLLRFTHLLTPIAHSFHTLRRHLRHSMDYRCRWRSNRLRIYTCSAKPIPHSFFPYYSTNFLAPSSSGYWSAFTYSLVSGAERHFFDIFVVSAFPSVLASVFVFFFFFISSHFAVTLPLFVHSNFYYYTSVYLFE